MDKITHILENVVRCKYFKAGVHIKNPIKNSYQDGLGRTTQTLDHVVVVHILFWDKRKSQINEYNDTWEDVRDNLSKPLKLFVILADGSTRIIIQEVWVPTRIMDFKPRNASKNLPTIVIFGFHDFQFSTAKERFSQTPWLISVVRPSILTLCILWMLWWIISNFVGTWRLIIVSTIWNLNFCFNFNAAHCRRTHRTRNPKGYVSSESNLT